MQMFNAGARLPRHRHSSGYVALVLAGGYREAGDRGRFDVAAGHAVVHGDFEAHKDDFAPKGARVINLPRIRELEPGRGFVADPDAIARAAERDLHEAAGLLLAQFTPAPAAIVDWPDRLARSLASSQCFSIGEWAETMGLAPQTISRGFRQAYGTSPKRYRAEQRTLLAIRALRGGAVPLAMLSAELGFADQAHLTRCIKMLTGMSPRQLRAKSVQERGTAVS